MNNIDKSSLKAHEELCEVRYEAIKESIRSLRAIIITMAGGIITGMFAIIMALLFGAG